MLSSKKTVAVAAAVLMLGNCANAIIINYGDFLGADFFYLQVTEDTRDQPMALFGAPGILGNTLDFDPLSFSAGVSSMTGTLNGIAWFGIAYSDRPPPTPVGERMGS